VNTADAKELLSKAIMPTGTAWRLLGGLYRAIKAFYRSATKSSIFFLEEELGMASLKHPKKLNMTLELFKPRSVLDLGCGTGWSLEYLLTHGIDAVGVEGSKLAISKSKHVERIINFNLNKELNLNRRFDLIWYVEVVEHIHPTYVHHLMRSFANHSDRVVLSAAPPGQGGEGHFNEQSPEYWIAMFAKYGFDCDATSTAALRQIPESFSSNMLVFHRHGRSCHKADAGD
jgi:SAM-dependent methyltransferase